MLRDNDIYVLGIHDGYCAGAALLKNGHVVAAINEERITMIKNHAGVPILSIQKVIDIARIKPTDIALVAVASLVRVVGDPEFEKDLFLFKLHMATARYLAHRRFVDFSVKLLHTLKPRINLRETLQTIGIDHTPTVFIEHHAAHAASAYYNRPWSDKTLVFTLDGMGDGLSATVSIGEGTTISRIAQSSYYDSPGNLIYAEITRYLGMKRGEHEYKVMGLAPYGNAQKTIDVFRKVIRLKPTSPLEFENRSGCYMEQLQLFYRKYLAYARFDDIAAGAQRAFEELVVMWVREAIRTTGIHKIAASGGSFLNVKTNMLLRRLPEAEDMFIYPACDDSGIAEGAALSAYVSYCTDHHEPVSISPLKGLYFGEEYSDTTIEEFLKRNKLRRNARKVMPDDVARMISRGKIIARFAGRDEWGPRALGNRSIMADPRNLAVVGHINRAIKQRDFWMPFAPAILEEDQARYVKDNHFTPYMVEALETKEKSVSDIIATVHPADKTTRPMTVNNWNPSWQHILREFKKKTGVGAILNTSFNLHGYPLVGTPAHALWTFQNSDLDGLILGGWFITKNRKLQ